MSHTEGRLIADENCIGIAYVDASDDEQTNEANARRLVACWNACDGIPIEQLECDQTTFVRMLLERQTLKQERDELLIALRTSTNGLRHCSRWNIREETEKAIITQVIANELIIAKYQEAV